MEWHLVRWNGYGEVRINTGALVVNVRHSQWEPQNYVIGGRH